MKNINKLLMLVILLFGLLQITKGYAEQSFHATEGELAIMPAYCQVKLGKDRGNTALEKKYRNIYGVDWGNMHHYCEALKYLIRANRSVDKAEITGGLQGAKQIIEHMLASEQTSSWILRPEALVNLGKINLKGAKYGMGSEAKAVQNLEQAIQIKSDYVPAYIALSDFYSDKGMKPKALGTIEDGLKYSPESKALLRRFKQLGGKTPPAPLEVKSGAPVELTAPSERQDPPESDSTAVSLPDDGTSQSSSNASGEQTTSSKIGSPTNPWCRFCTDVEEKQPVKAK